MSNQNDDIIYGAHAVKALLKFSPERIKVLSLQEGKEDKTSEEIIEMAAEFQITLKILAKKSLEKIAQSHSHQGVVAQCQPMKLHQEKDIERFLSQTKSSPLVLIFDGIQDPQNLGACLRTADAFGVDFVVLSKNQTVGLTSVVHKASCGASQTVPIVQVTNLSRSIRLLKENGVWIVGAVANRVKTIAQVDFTIPTALILGSEGSGLRKNTETECDHLVSIPMLGYVESLNISVANAVCLYECQRQRQTDGV